MYRAFRLRWDSQTLVQSSLWLQIRRRRPCVASEINSQLINKKELLWTLHF